MKEIIRINKIDAQANVSNPIVDVTPNGDVIRGDGDKAGLISPILRNHDVDKALGYLDGPKYIAQAIPVGDVDYDIQDYTDEPVVVDKASGEWVPYQGPLGGEGFQHTGTGEVRYQDRKPTDDPTEPKVPGFVEERPETDTSAENLKAGEWIVYENLRNDTRYVAQVEENEGEAWTGGVSINTESGGILDMKVDEDDDLSTFELVGVTDSEQAARTYAYSDSEKVELDFSVKEDPEDGVVLDNAEFAEGDLVTVEETGKFYDDDEGDFVEDTRTSVGIVSEVFDGRSTFDMNTDPTLEIRQDPDKKFEIESFNLADDRVTVSRPAGQIVNAKPDNAEITEAEKEALSQIEYYTDFRGNATMSKEQIRITDDAVQRVVGSLKDDQIAKDIFGDGFRTVRNKDMRGNGTGSISRRGDDREIQLNVTEDTDRDTVIHETGHLLAEMYGFAVSGDASREAKVGYEPSEPFPFDNDEEDYLLSPRDDYAPAIDGYEEGEWYQSHAGEPPEEVENLIDSVNDAWRKQKELVEAEDIDWQSATVALGYSQVNAHETLANFHEAYQTDDPYTATKAATATLQHHPELWNAYVEVFEPSYEMKKAMQNWKTYLGRRQGNETFERSIVKNAEDLSVTIKENGKTTGKVRFGETPAIKYDGDSPAIANLLTGLPGRSTVPAGWDGSISNDRRVTLSPRQQYEQFTDLLDIIDTVTVEKADSSPTQKDWVPYEGPFGGQGWQRTSDGEVRYVEEPPGEVADGYENVVANPVEVETFPEFGEVLYEEQDAKELMTPDSSSETGAFNEYYVFENNGERAVGEVVDTETDDTGIILDSYTLQTENGETFDVSVYDIAGAVYYTDPGTVPDDFDYVETDNNMNIDDGDVLAIDTEDGIKPFEVSETTFSFSEGGVTSFRAYRAEDIDRKLVPGEFEPEDVVGYVTDSRVPGVTESAEARVERSEFPVPEFDSISSHEDLEEGDVLVVQREDDLRPQFARVKSLNDPDTSTAVTVNYLRDNESGLVTDMPSSPIKNHAAGVTNESEAKQAILDARLLNSEEIAQRGYEEASQVVQSVEQIAERWASGDIDRVSALAEMGLTVEQEIGIETTDFFGTEMAIDDTMEMINRVSIFAEEVGLENSVDMLSIGETSLPPTASRVPAVFMPPQDIGRGSIDQPSVHYNNDAFNGMKTVDGDWFSTNTQYHNVLHELGHAAHYKNLVENVDDVEYNEFNRALDDDRSEPYDPVKVQDFSDELSDYGDTNVFELIAETSVLKMLGRDVPDPIQNVYEEFHGAELPELDIPTRKSPVAEEKHKSDTETKSVDAYRRSATLTAKGFRAWLKQQIESD